MKKSFKTRSRRTFFILIPIIVALVALTIVANAGGSNPELTVYLGDGYDTLSNSFIGTAIENITASRLVGSSTTNTHYELIENKEQLKNFYKVGAGVSATGGYGGVTADASFGASILRGTTTNSDTMTIAIIYKYNGEEVVLNSGTFNKTAKNLINSAKATSIQNSSVQSSKTPTQSTINTPKIDLFKQFYGNSFVKKAYLGGYLYINYTAEISDSSKVSKTDLKLALGAKYLGLIGGSISPEFSKTSEKILSNTKVTGSCISTCGAISSNDLIDTKAKLDAKVAEFSNYYNDVKNKKIGEYYVTSRELRPYWSVTGSGYYSSSYVPKFYDGNIFKAQNVNLSLNDAKDSIVLKWEDICTYEDGYCVYYKTDDMDVGTQAASYAKNVTSATIKIPEGYARKHFSVWVAPKFGSYIGQYISKDINPYFGNSLWNTEELHTGDSLVSNNGQYKMILQKDGNLVISKYSNGAAVGVPWASNTGGKQVVKFIMQSDGNFVGYDASNKPHFDTKTYKRYNKGSYITLGDDGVLVVNNTKNKPQWKSKHSSSMNKFLAFFR